MSLADYEVGEKIGSGSFGQVYLLTRKTDGKNFALKVIPSGDQGIDSLSECDILFRLQHLHLLHAEALFFTDPEKKLEMNDHQNMMFVLPLAISNMKNFIQQNPPLATRIRFCWECATAIKMLQDNGVHHLDLKPENVFVFSSSDIKSVLEEPTSKLGDFGLICYGTPEGCNLTIPAFTADYRPPEEFIATRPLFSTILTEKYPVPSLIPWDNFTVVPNESS